MCRSKETSELRVTGLCEGGSPVTDEFPTQRASNAENVSIGWRHHDIWEGNYWGDRSIPLTKKSVSCYDVIITPYLPVANRTHSLAPQPRSMPHTWTSPKSWWNYQNRLIGCRSTASPEKKQRRMQFVLTIFFQDGKTHKKCLTKTNIASRHFITMTS